MGILLGVVAKAVVKGGVGGVELDVVDQFTAFGSGQGRSGKLAAAALSQEQILHGGGIVSCQFHGLRHGGQHFRAPVEFSQAQQTAQLDAGFDWTTIQAEMKRPRLGPQASNSCSSAR